MGTGPHLRTGCAAKDEPTALAATNPAAGGSRRLYKHASHGDGEVWSQSSTVVRSKGTSGPPPTLLTKISSRPNSLAAAAMS